MRRPTILRGLMRRHRARVRSEAGATLLELMLATGLLAVVMTIFLSLLSSVFTGLGRQTDRSNDNDQARLAVEQLDREIRSGNLLYDPADETGPVGSDIVGGMSLRVYTQANADTRDPANRCVQWRITSGGALQRRDWSVNWGIDGVLTPWREVASDVVNRSLDPQVTAFALDPDQMKFGRAVVITIVVNTNVESGQPVEIQQTVTGRNTGYGYPSEICNSIPPY